MSSTANFTRFLSKDTCNKFLTQKRSLYDAPLKVSFDPYKQDHKIPDYDYNTLRSISKFHFGVEYLGIAEKPPSFPVEGLILCNK